MQHDVVGRALAHVFPYVFLLGICSEQGKQGDGEQRNFFRHNKPELGLQGTANRAISPEAIPGRPMLGVVAYRYGEFDYFYGSSVF